jgi:hypothetical protein
MATEEFEVTVEIRCIELPAAPWPDRGTVLLGIQKNEEVVEIAPLSRNSLVFRPSLRVRKYTDGSPNFLGPFAQGPRPERFIYLVWLGGNPGGAMAMLGRVKVHLNHITWAQVAQAQKQSEPLKVTLPLTNAKGGPVCASVRTDWCRWEL